MSEEKLDELHSKLDRIDGRLDSIDTTLIKQELSLEEHIRRTNLLEEEIRPIKKHVMTVEAIFKVIGMISVILGILAAITEIVKR